MYKVTVYGSKTYTSLDAAKKELMRLVGQNRASAIASGRGNTWEPPNWEVVDMEGETVVTASQLICDEGWDIL